MLPATKPTQGNTSKVAVEVGEAGTVGNFTTRSGMTGGIGGAALAAHADWVLPVVGLAVARVWPNTPCCVQHT